MGVVAGVTGDGPVKGQGKIKGYLDVAGLDIDRMHVAGIVERAMAAVALEGSVLPQGGHLAGGVRVMAKGAFRLAEIVRPRLKRENHGPRNQDQQGYEKIRFSHAHGVISAFVMKDR
jgi:hypothetical protein